MQVPQEHMVGLNWEPVITIFWVPLCLGKCPHLYAFSLCQSSTCTHLADVLDPTTRATLGLGHVWSAAAIPLLQT